MKLIYTKHLKDRLEQRQIPLSLIPKVFKNATGKYWDNLRNRSIVIGETLYKGKSRKLLVAYDKINSSGEIITIHPISDKQIDHRLKSERWVYEKDKN